MRTFLNSAATKEADAKPVHSSLWFAQVTNILPPPHHKPYRDGAKVRANTTPKARIQVRFLLRKDHLCVRCFPYRRSSSYALQEIAEPFKPNLVHPGGRMLC